MKWIYRNEKDKNIGFNNRNFLLISILELIYAHYEFYDLQIKRYEIVSTDIPKEFDGKKVLFVSDFQFDTDKKFNEKMMRKVVNRINSEKKDIIVLGGDYTDTIKFIPRFYEEMQKMKIPKYGIYSVLGNHDYWSSADEHVKNLKKLGYNVLINENTGVKIGNEKIFISGVDDYWNEKIGSDAEKALNGIKKEDFNIFLSHNPDYFEDMTQEQRNLMDIGLAGHTHAGQITFFGQILIAPLKYKDKYGYGMKNYDGHKFYITSGVGGSVKGMFIRFFAKPEIVVFTLRRS